MHNNTTCSDFSGQHFYIGIDTHKSNWKVTIRTRDIELKTFSMNPSPEELCKHMNQNYPNGIYHSVYEAGFCGFWIHRKLTSYSFKNIIVNPSDVPSTNKERDRKSDPIDSRKLSRELSKNSLDSVYVPSEYEEGLRCIHRLYKQNSRRVIQLKNRIKALLHFTGIIIPLEYDKRCWSNSFIDYLYKLTDCERLHNDVLQDLLSDLKHARKQKLDSLRRIRTLSKGLTVVKLLKTIPGIGHLTAFALYAELIDMKRFRNLDHLASYIGLVPSVQSSDTTVKVGGITFRHNKYLRSALIESAWVALGNDPALLNAYNQLTIRLKGSDAIVRIAKKLLNRVMYVWNNQKEYVKGILQVEK